MKYTITSKYKSTEHFREHAHNGVDFSMPGGTELYSIQGGVVKTVDYGNENIGNGLLVKWADGKTAIYGHLSEVKVETGDIIKEGTLIGLSGNSGNVFSSTGGGGYHLHFGLKDTNGEFIDPSPYIPLIQSMGEKISQYKIDAADMLNRALEGMSNINLNFISQLLDFHTAAQALHVIFPWIA